LEKGIEQEEKQIEGFVGFCEPLGSETVIHLRVESQEVLAMSDPDTFPAPNRRIKLSIEMEKIHLFDPATGTAIF
jgi:multiple sugar transport system ATP-binding protein